MCGTRIVNRAQAVFNAIGKVVLCVAVQNLACTLLIARNRINNLTLGYSSYFALLPPPLAQQLASQDLVTPRMTNLAIDDQTDI